MDHGLSSVHRRRQRRSRFRGGLSGGRGPRLAGAAYARSYFDLGASTTSGGGRGRPFGRGFGRDCARPVAHAALHGRRRAPWLAAERGRSSSATVGGARLGTDLVPKHERPVRPTWSAGKRTSVCTDLAGGWWASGVVTCRLRRHLGAGRRALRPNLGALVGLTVPTEAHEHALAEGEADWPPNSTSNHIIVSWLPVISVAGVRKLWRCRSPSRAV